MGVGGAAVDMEADILLIGGGGLPVSPPGRVTSPRLCRAERQRLTMLKRGDGAD